MTKTRWWLYVETLLGDDTMKEAAKKAGFNQSAFTRWKNGARADPDFVVKLARAYGANVLSALVAADFINEEEAGVTGVDVPTNSSRIPHSTIASEVEKRLRRLSSLESAEVLDLNAHRSNTDATPDVEPESYAADSSPDEPMEGDDDYGGGA